MYTRQLLGTLSAHRVRDQCFDGLVHPKSGLPMRESTRIQSHDTSFLLQFRQRCVGHETEHVHIEGKRITYGTSFYPKRFCQRAVQLWKSWDDKTTPKGFVRKFRDAQLSEDARLLCGTCGPCSVTSPNGCDKCSDDTDDTASPAVAEIMQDIPEDGEGDHEQTAQQRLMRLHKTRGVPQIASWP